MNYRIGKALLPELRAALHTEQADKISHLLNIRHNLYHVYTHDVTGCMKTRRRCYYKLHVNNIVFGIALQNKMLLHKENETKPNTVFRLALR